MLHLEALKKVVLLCFCNNAIHLIIIGLAFTHISSSLANQRGRHEIPSLKINSKREVEERNNKFISEQPLKLTSIENRYGIKNSYAFFNPTISVDCDCSCSESDGHKSSESPSRKEDGVNQHHNKDRIWTSFYKNGTDVNVCARQYSMYCRIKLSVPQERDKKFRAMKLEHSVLNYHFRLTDSGSGEKNGNDEIIIKGDVSKIIVDNKRMFYLNKDRLNIPLQDEWCYTCEDTDIVMVDGLLNEDDGEDLNKLGWFRYDSSAQLHSINESQIWQHLSVNPRNCEGKNSSYDWKLDYKSPEGIPLLQKYEKEISIIEVMRSKDVIITKQKNSDFLEKITLQEIAVNDEELVFDVEITKIETSNFTFRLAVLKGKGSFNVKVNTSNSEELDNFPLHLHNNVPDYYVKRTIYPSHSIKKPLLFCFQRVFPIGEITCRIVKFIQSPNSPATTIIEPENGEMISVLKSGIFYAIIAVIGLCLLITMMFLISSHSNRIIDQYPICMSLLFRTRNGQDDHPDEESAIPMLPLKSESFCGKQEMFDQINEQEMAVSFVTFCISRQKDLEMTVKTLLEPLYVNNVDFTSLEMVDKKLVAGGRIALEQLFHEEHSNGASEATDSNAVKNTFFVKCNGDISLVVSKLIYDYLVGSQYLLHINKLFLILPETKVPKDLLHLFKSLGSHAVCFNEFKPNYTNNTDNSLLLIENIDALSKNNQKCLMDVVFNSPQKSYNFITSSKTSQIINNSDTGMKYSYLNPKTAFLYERKKWEGRDSNMVKQIMIYLVLSELRAERNTSPLRKKILKIFSSKNKELKSLVNTFGEYSLKSLKNKKDSLDLVEEMNSSMPTKDVKLYKEFYESYFGNKNNTKYEKNLLLILAALFLGLNISTDEEETLSDKLIDDAVWLGLISSKYFPLALEIGGKKQFYKYLSKLAPWAFWFLITSPDTPWKHLLNNSNDFQNEVQNNKLQTILFNEGYYSPEIKIDFDAYHYYFFTSNYFRNVLDCGFKLNCIRSLIWNIKYAVNFPQSFAVESLELKIEENVDEGMNVIENNATEIKCDHLQITVNDFTEQNWNRVTSFLSRVQSERKSINIFVRNTERFLPILYQNITIGCMNTFHFHSFKCSWDESRERPMFQIITDLVNKGKIVNELWLDILENNFGVSSVRHGNFKKFLQSVADSPSLNVFSINFSKNFNLKIDLDLLFRTKKKWKFLKFGDNVQFQIKDKINGTIVDSLELGYSQRVGNGHEELVKNLPINSLKLDANFFSCLTSKFHSHTWHNISELVVTFYSQVYIPNQLQNLAKMKSLSSLSINFNDLQFAIDNTIDFDHLVAFVKKHYLNELKFDNVNVTCIKFLMEFINGIKEKNNCDANEINTKFVINKLKIQLYEKISINLFESLLLSLQNAFQNRACREIHLLISMDSEINKQILISFPPSKSYRIKRELVYNYFTGLKEEYIVITKCFASPV